MECLLKDKPVYIFSGEDDPVGHRGKGVRRLIEMYRKHGIKILNTVCIPAAATKSHEINRDEVAAHVLDWLERHTSESHGTRDAARIETRM